MTNQICNFTNQTYAPKVSVVIPIYNGETDLPDLIDCLCHQSYPQELVEYLLVDNASCDRTAQIIKAAVRDATSQGITIRYVSEDKIQSSYAARNTGIRFSSGEILCFTDVDCRPHGDWVSALIKPFADPEVVLVGGAIIALPGTTLMEKYAEQQNLLSHKGLMSNPFHPYAQTANLAIRRKALETVGLFRPYLTTGGDADMCWRIQQQNSWQLHCAEEAIVRHRHRKTLKGLLSQWRRYGRSHQYLNELHGIDLQKDSWNRKKYLRHWKKWLLHEFPRCSIKILLGRATLLELLTTPINLLTLQARVSEREKTKLPEKARQIEWLSNNKIKIQKSLN